MKACKHLDYAEKYSDCKIVELDGFPCQVRYSCMRDLIDDGCNSCRWIEICNLMAADEASHENRLFLEG